MQKRASAGSLAAHLVRQASRPVAGLGLSLAEALAVAAGFLLLWAVLARAAGGPLYSDELWYIQIGLNDTLEINVLNRYFHIYLQKLFMELAPAPIVGVRAFWGFLVALTASLVYMTARTLAPDSNLLHGGLALALFFAFPALAETSGMGFVDLTAMAMTAVMVLVYLIGIRGGGAAAWPVVALGALFFLGLKTKETTVVMGVLVLGLGFEASGAWALRRLRVNALRFAAGFAVGVLIFIILNAVILGEPLFGLRPADLAAFSQVLATTEGLNPEAADWYSGYLLSVLPVTTLLYLLSGAKHGGRFPPAVRVLWIVPLALIAFLSLSMIRGDWGIRPRHLFPVLPLLCVTGAQVLRFEAPARLRERAWLAGGVALALVGLGLVRSIGMLAADRLETQFAAILSSVLFPIALSGLLAVLMLRDKGSVPTLGLTLMLASVTLYGSLQTSLVEVFVVRTVARQYDERVYALRVFEQHIAYSDSTRILVSTNAAAGLWNPSANPDTMLSLFNLHFDASSTRANFAHLDLERARLEQVLAPDYDYVLLTAQDWQALTDPPGARAALEGAYQVLDEPRQDFYLLVAR